MGFKTDTSQAQQGYDIKPEGDYECILIKCEEKTTKNGATGLNFSMVIRNDINQPFQNGYIFHTLWKRKQPTKYDEQVNGYGFGQIMAMAQACQLEDGKEYETLEDFLIELLKKPLKATLRHEEYNGRMQERVSFVNPTDYPEVKHKFKEKTDSNTYAAQNQTFAKKESLDITYEDEISDEDLPF